MHAVAVMSQELRVAQCVAYFSDSAAGQTGLILVSNIAVFDSLELPPGVCVAAIGLGRLPLPSTKHAASNLRSRIIRWARSGSGFGRGVERVARRLTRVLRLADKAPLIRRLRRGHTAEFSAVRPDLHDALQRAHDAESITLIIVFDVYDLPTAMEFAAEVGTSVIVR